MIRRWLLLSSLVVLIAACSGGGSKSGTSTTTTTSVPAAKVPAGAAGWVRSDLKPVTQPEPVDGDLVLYVQAGGGLQVVALDSKTGRTLWHDDASPGEITPGVVPALGVTGSIVTFLSPIDNSTGAAQVVGVDAASGRQLWHTSTGMFEDWPVPCPDNPSTICTSGSLGQAQQTQALRFGASTGTPAGAAAVSTSPGGRGLAPNLFDPGVRHPEMLLAVRGSAVAWSRPIASVFPLQGASSDNGWNFDLVPAGGLFVGSVEGPPVSSSGSSATIDLSRTMTAGFRISDGTAVWRDAGTMYACNQPLPCPGGLRMAELGLAYRAPTAGLRLRATGTATATQSSPIVQLSPDAKVTVEGFELATGKTMWSYNAEADGPLLSQTPPLIGPSLAILPAPAGGTVALNLATGAHSPVPSGAVAWCQSVITYTTKVAYQGGNLPPDYNRVGQQSIQPCQASAASAPTPQTVPGFIGTVIVGLTAWSESSEVLAAPSS